MFTTDLGTGKGNWKPNAAIWINDKRYQIIDNYMRNNEISLSRLMQRVDAQEILLESKYKP